MNGAGGCCVRLQIQSSVCILDILAPSLEKPYLLDEGLSLDMMQLWLVGERAEDLGEGRPGHSSSQQRQGDCHLHDRAARCRHLKAQCVLQALMPTLKR